MAQKFVNFTSSQTAFFKRLIVKSYLGNLARTAIKKFRQQSQLKQSSVASEWKLRVQRDNQIIERFLSEVLMRDSNCIDIGAYEGVFLQRFKKLSPNGHHFAFEPLPKLAILLEQKFPQVEVINCALSNNDSKATFFYAEKFPCWSGLKVQSYPGKTSLKKYKVNVKRLDDVILSNVFVNFIKIDVEGGEFDVLKGAEKIIKRCKPYILFEHAKIHTMQYKTSPKMIYNLLANEYSLEVYSLTNNKPLTEKEFVSIYHSSFASNYDRHAETNFLAMPPSNNTI